MATGSRVIMNPDQISELAEDYPSAARQQPRCSFKDESGVRCCRPHRHSGGMHWAPLSGGVVGQWFGDANANGHGADEKIRREDGEPRHTGWINTWQGPRSQEGF